MKFARELGSFCESMTAMFVQDSDEDEMEDARRAYMDAISAAKENPNEETLCAAAAARRRLQAFVLQ